MQNIKKYTHNNKMIDFNFLKNNFVLYLITEKIMTYLSSKQQLWDYVIPDFIAQYYIQYTWDFTPDSNMSVFPWTHIRTQMRYDRIPYLHVQMTIEILRYWICLEPCPWPDGTLRYGRWWNISELESHMAFCCKCLKFKTFLFISIL